MFNNLFGGIIEEDEIDVEILADGSLKITTDPISGANHASAENMIEAIEAASGGAIEIESKSEHHSHGHNHNHLHN